LERGDEEVGPYTRSVAGRKLDKKEFFIVFNPAFQKCMSVANAQNAFRGSGLFHHLIIFICSDKNT